MPSLSVSELTDRLKAEAARLGFDQVGIAPAVMPAGFGYYEEWLSRGFASGMAYLHRQRQARAHPNAILEGVRSLVVTSIVYRHPDTDEATGPTRGKVARYARGTDYHELFWRRLERLLRWLETESPGVRGRAVSDTAPLLERDFARLAGLGWIGKNSMLIDRTLGSYTLLGALLVDIELSYDQPLEKGYCGTCTRCLDACPTDAFAGPYQLDARKCISYWTIEHKGPIPDGFADRLHGWAFGCDVCQEVCPWNRKAPPSSQPEFAPRPGWSSPDLIEWLDADPSEFRRRLKGTAMARAKRSGLLRNAALILGERRERSAISSLIARLDDDDPVIRGASAWALGRIGTPESFEALRLHRNDPDPAARDAIRRALGFESDSPATAAPADS